MTSQSIPSPAKHCGARAGLAWRARAVPDRPRVTPDSRVIAGVAGEFEQVTLDPFVVRGEGRPGPRGSDKRSSVNRSRREFRDRLAAGRGQFPRTCGPRRLARLDVEPSRRR